MYKFCNFTCLKYPPLCAIGECNYCLKQKPKMYTLISNTETEKYICSLCKHHFPLSSLITQNEDDFDGVFSLSKYCIVNCATHLENARKNFYSKKLSFDNIGCLYAGSQLEDQCEWNKNCMKCDIRKLSDLNYLRDSFRSKESYVLNYDIIFENTCSEFKSIKHHYTR